MNLVIAAITTTALGELCAGGAICVGGIIGLVSLRASPKRRGQLFHGKTGKGAPLSKASIALLSAFLLTFGGTFVFAGLTTGNAPDWAFPLIAMMFVMLMASGFIDTLSEQKEKKPNQPPEPTRPFGPSGSS